MKAKKCHLLLAASFFLSLSCAPFMGGSDLEQRVNEQDMQLRDLQPRQADTENEVQAMRQEIAQLKGQIAAMNRPAGAQPLDPDGPQYQADAAQAAPGPGSVAREPVGGINPSPVNVPGSGVSTPGGSYPSAYGQPQVATASYGLPPDAPVAPAVAPSEATWGKADPVPEAETPVVKKDISLALFDAGVNAFNARQYQEAERSFRDFIKNYPNHTQTAAAQFYLAECQFQMNRFPEAALAYDTIISKYPKSSSAASAYLKQGIAFSKMGQGDAAKARMQEVIKKFPNAPEAARAKTFLKTNK